MQPLLQVKNLSIGFEVSGNFLKAVNDISFSVKKGETIGIVGESGSGKSVTALCIMKLLAQNAKITSGEVFFDGENILHFNEKQMQQLRGNKISMIFQDPMSALNPVISCGRQVDEAIILHQKVSANNAKEHTLELFNKVKLPRIEDIYNSFPHELSGGQLQRIMIAMAISNNPVLLIADEPTTALDVTIQKNILELLKNLQQQIGMSMIFISHDLNVVRHIAGQIAVMHGGIIVENNEVNNIYNTPSHSYTKALLACRPDSHKKITRLAVVSDFVEENNGIFIEKNISVDELLNNLAVTEIRKDEPLQNIQLLLDVQNLKKYFNNDHTLFSVKKEQVKAIDNVSFKLYKGETLGIVGESGSGKTTLGRIILRLITPDSGAIFFKGKNIFGFNTTGSKEFCRLVQVIFQNPYSALNPYHTAGYAITEPMIIHKIYTGKKEQKNRAVELLEKVGLSAEHFSRYPHQLSGGQRQRICIARALSVNPELLICDEAVSSLDVSVQAMVLNILNDLKKDFGFTCIFISHDLSVVKYMSDRILVMKDGKIEESGNSDQIYYAPQSDYTRQLIDSMV